MVRRILKSLLVLVPALLVLASGAFAESTFTGSIYWTPKNVTTAGEKIDHILNFIFVLTTIVFILTQAFLIFYLVKYRRKPGVKAHYSHGNNKLEIVWTALPTAIFIGLVIWSDIVWHDLLIKPPPEDAIPVQIVGYQFGWDFLYAGADKKAGEIDVKLLSPQNKFGKIQADEKGKDDFTSAEMIVPVNKPVQVFLQSRDVIHSFYVPQFRLYQDAVPGRTISWLWFQATQTGNFELACSQLCGAGHFNMKAKIRVVSLEEYEKWYADKAKAAAAAASAAPQAQGLAQTQPSAKN